MDVLLRYLEKNALLDEQISEKPSNNLNICIVIPAYNEDNIITVINSLLDCYIPKSDVELIIVLNTHENDSNEIIQKTQKCENEILFLKNKLSEPKVKIHLIKAFNLPKKVAGVGFARKIGMDESIRRFLKVKNINGIIACLDADCTVEKNYLIELEKLFTLKKAKACSIKFQHPTSGSKYNEDIYKAIIQYELYLHYHLLSIRNTGHPFAFHTIGSSFAVRADVYAMQGGMNQRKGGEDFYFLQKIIPLGNFFELNSTCVYPSPRISTRVPFGTGIAVKNFLEQKQEHFYVYHPEAYSDLKTWFKNVLYNYENLTYNFEGKISQELNKFLVNINIYERLQEIKSNTSNFDSFKKRFFRWFNMFQVIKYLNYAHQKFYSKLPVCEASYILLNNLNIHKVSKEPIELLKWYRNIIYNDAKFY